MQRMEKTLHLKHLRPKFCDVKLRDKSSATVPVFDAKAMILDILNNPTCMMQSNFAVGYNVLTGSVDQNHPANQQYDEVHTGDAWMPARNQYCPQNDSNNNMPVALIVFGDKSHTDLHGALSLMPVIFALTMFNRTFRNNMRGDRWHIFRIYHMGRIKQIRQKLHQKYRTNTRVFLWSLNQSGTYTKMGGLKRLSWARRFV